MKLYIKIENGKPVGHPATEENILQAFPGIDLSSPESGFEPFRRVLPPQLGSYHVLEDMIYIKSGNEYVDIYPIRNMTPPEKEKYKSIQRKLWLDNKNPPSWVLDDKTGKFIPPVPKPTDGPYRWDEDSLSWKKLEALQ